MAAFCQIHLFRRDQKPGQVCNKTVSYHATCGKCDWEEDYAFGTPVPTSCPRCGGTVSKEPETCGRELLDVHED